MDRSGCIREWDDEAVDDPNGDGEREGKVLALWGRIHSVLETPAGRPLLAWDKRIERTNRIHPSGLYVQHCEAPHVRLPLSAGLCAALKRLSCAFPNRNCF